MNDADKQDERDFATLYKWAVIENIVTLMVMFAFYWLTHSLWVFLFVFNLNSPKSKT